MTELLTAAEMRARERAAIESGAVRGLDLMERAGRGVLEAVLHEWPDLGRAPHHAVVLCGPGNNGGDGFVVARLLRELGWRVTVYLYGAPENLPPDARANFLRWQELGQVRPWSDLKPASLHAHLFVDAVFGAGLSRAPSADVMQPLRELCAGSGMSGRMVAVDAPSGLCMDSGRALSAEFGASKAQLTVSFHRARPGHYLADGPFYCGKLRVVAIGLPKARTEAALRLCAAPSADLAKSASAHKYAHGHALVLTGGAGRTGAARLAARGALRIGAGLVTLGVPGSAQHEVASQIAALMLQRVDDASALAAALEDRRINALCLGPGLGLARARDLVAVALGSGGARPRPTVLDADALTAHADAPDALFALLHEDCVLTPHGGEFARLFPDIAAKLDAPATAGPACSKVDAVRAAARRAGCVVLLKGADTVIADPAGRAVISAAQYDRAAPWLATAGAGDVLAGFVAGLLARGFGALQAAETASWLHVECARRFGPGLIAEDLPEMLPQVLRALADDAGSGQGTPPGDAVPGARPPV